MRLRTISEKLSARQVRVAAGTLLLAIILTGGGCCIMQLDYAVAQSGSSAPSAIVDSTATIAAEALPSSTVTVVAVAPEPAPTQTSNPQLPLLGRRVGLDPGHGPRED